MMKNKMMRIASVLLVAVLLSTCVISGTFAKYVTSDSSNDTARVAKWGVSIVASGDELFNNEYRDTTNGITVTSIDDANVVAPGTSNAEFGATGMNFTIKGKPEVAVKFTYEFVASEDIFLGTGTYSDETTGDITDEYTVAAKYYPVVYTLKKDGVEVASGNLEAIKNYFDNLSTEMIAPNTVLDTVYVLTWAWDFGDATENNQKDTTLGNLAAETTSTTNEYNLDLTYSLTITVEQVD